MQKFCFFSFSVYPIAIKAYDIKRVAEQHLCIEEEAADEQFLILVHSIRCVSLCNSQTLNTIIVVKSIHSMGCCQTSFPSTFHVLRLSRQFSGSFHTVSSSFILHFLRSSLQYLKALHTDRSRSQRLGFAASTAALFAILKHLPHSPILSSEAIAHI